MRGNLVSLLLVVMLLINLTSVSGNYDISMDSKDNDFEQLFFHGVPHNKANQVLTTSFYTFTKNCGQLDNDAVRFYARGGEIWFTDDGVWFELRENIEGKNQESKARTQEPQTPTLPNSQTPPLIHSQTPPQKYKRIILKQEFLGANRVRPEGRERLSWNSNFFYGKDSSKWCSNVPNYQEVYYENLYNGIDLRYYHSGNGLKYDLIVHPGANPNNIRIKYKGVKGLKIDEFGNLNIITDFKDIIDTSPYIYQNINGGHHQILGRFRLYNPQVFGFEILQEYNEQEILIIDPTVQLEYSTYLGGSDYDLSYKVDVDASGNAFVTGKTKSSNFPTTPGSFNTSYNTRNDIFVTKVNPTGSSLVYSTFIGGAEDDIGFGIAIDNEGNAYVTGESGSSDFPTTKNAYDTSLGEFYNAAIILKLSHNGSMLLYSTFVEGNNPDYGYGIDVDANGNAYVVGYTLSWTFPTTSNAYNQSFSQYSDIFILKLNKTGQKLIYSTYVGGRYWDYGLDMALDNTGCVYVVGRTSSDNFPTTPTAFNRSYSSALDCIIFKLNQTGSKLIYSTYLGGGSTDNGLGIAIDAQGYAYVTGYTRSSDFPITSSAFDPSYNGGSEDAFICKLNQTGSKLVYSTFIGDTYSDYGYGIDVDSIGCACIIGTTGSKNFPRTSDAYDNTYNLDEAFLLKLAPNGSALVYSTFLGGGWTDEGRGIVFDSVGNAYMTGYTESSDFPTTPNAFNKSNQGSSDIFVAKFSFQPVLTISSLSLLTNNMTTDTAYSKFSPYTFRTIVIDTASITDLNTVHLTLDPLGTNIELKWVRSSGQFTKLNDPNNYISIDESSNGYNFFNLWTIDFNLTINWNYPDEELHDVQVKATSATLSPAWLNSSEVYEVENDLCFNGTLIVNNEDGKRLANNDLVRGGEKLTWTGLTPIYENSTDKYPPDEEFDITIMDDDDKSYLCSPAPGEPFYIELNTPDDTYTTGYNYAIRITGIPPECDKTNENFMLRIDADDVVFSEEIPVSTTWHTTYDVLVGVTITDFGGGDVNSSTVKHQLSINNGSSWGSWKTVPNLQSGMSLNVKDTVTVKEGKNNLIRWQAEDSVGNGPMNSAPYRILVDTESIIYLNAWPLNNEESLTENVDVGITIMDAISGVNASTIEYSTSEDDGKTWGPWTTVEGFKSSKKVDVRINITFPNGTNNLLKWRATDIAGNEPVESQWQVINVNTWTQPIKPKVTLISPLNAMIVKSTNVELIWELEEPSLENITYDVCFDTKNPPDELQTDLINTKYTIDGLKDGMTYYWRVISYKDREITNSYKSPVWWFKVELPESELEKIYKLKITGPEYISMFPGENKSVSLTITNLGSTSDMIDINLQAGNLTTFITLDDYSMLTIESNNYDSRNVNIILPILAQPGIYKILIIATSMNSGEKIKANHTLTVEIKELVLEKPGKDKQPGEQDYSTLLISIAIIIIILLIGFVIFIYNRKKQLAKKLPVSEALTTKPLPSQIISVGDTQQIQPSQYPTLVTPPISSQQPQVPSTHVPTPTLAVSPTVAQAPAIPSAPQVGQVPRLPQLPPAQPQTEAIKPSDTTPESAQPKPSWIETQQSTQKIGDASKPQIEHEQQQNQ